MLRRWRINSTTSPALGGGGEVGVAGAVGGNLSSSITSCTHNVSTSSAPRHFNGDISTCTLITRKPLRIVPSLLIEPLKQADLKIQPFMVRTVCDVLCCTTLVQPCHSWNRCKDDFDHWNHACLPRACDRSKFETSRSKKHLICPLASSSATDKPVA